MFTKPLEEIEFADIDEFCHNFLKVFAPNTNEKGHCYP